MVNTNMKTMRLPEEAQVEIREFLMATQGNLDNQNNMNHFVDMLSPSLKTLVMQHIFLNAFNKNSLFQNDKPLIDHLIKDIIPHLRRPDDFIVQ